jgi:hypothetical protein
MTDKRLFAAALGDIASWSTWRTVLKAAFGEALDDQEAVVFREAAGGRAPPARPVNELWIIAGRRSGKSHVAGLLAVHLSIFSNYRLSAGERAVVLIVAPSIPQTKIVFDYAAGAIAASVALSKEVVEITKDEIRFRNNTTIMTAASVPRTLRGRSMLAVVIDEAAHLRDEGAATDAEVYRAVAPAVGASGGLLIGISTPHRRAGLVFERHSRCFGKDDPDVLVVQAGSRVLNPGLADAMIAAQRASDPALAASEWDAEFRSDICQLLDDAVIDAAIDDRPVELSPVAGTVYRAFVDVGGSGASEFSIAIGHRDVGRGRLIVDVVRSTPPGERYNVIETVAAYAALLRQYRINEVCGDHYGGSIPAACWRDANIRHVRSTFTKNELYIEAAGHFLRGLVSLPDMPRLITQLRLLERRVSAIGKDTVTSGKRADDMANVAAGVVHELARRRGFLDEIGWMSDAKEEAPMANQWESPADRRQRALLDRVRAPVAGMPIDLLLQQLALSDRQQRMVDRVVETVPLAMRSALLRDFADRIAPSPADGAVDAALNIALDRTRREAVA